MAFLLLNCFELSFLIAIGPKSQLGSGKQTLQNTVRQILHGLDTLRQALYGLDTLRQALYGQNTLRQAFYGLKEERVYPASGANFSVSLNIKWKFAIITYISLYVIKLLYKFVLVIVCLLHLHIKPRFICQFPLKFPLVFLL